MLALKSEVSTVYEILHLKHPEPASYLDLNDTLKHGLPHEVIAHVATTIGLPPIIFRRYIIADRTYHRRVSQGANLTRDESEKIYRAARIFAQARQCFHNAHKAQKFLTSEHPMLKGRVPIELVTESEAGFQAVSDVLLGLLYSTAV